MHMMSRLPCPLASPCCTASDLPLANDVGSLVHSRAGLLKHGYFCVHVCPTTCSRIEVGQPACPALWPCCNILGWPFVACSVLKQTQPCMACRVLGFRVNPKP